MGNIVDYIIEHGDKTLDELPFNEVDSLVLSQFSYLKFDNLFEGQGSGQTIGSLKDHPEYEQLFTDSRFESVNRGLFEAMMESRRFSQVSLFDHVNMVDAKWEIQFSAITCIFENGFVYVAYRGTDETFTGWKEDFNMAFITPVPAQTKAVQYLNRVALNVRGGLTVGGHSKGGNLAVYAAMKCLPEVRDRIVQIYSHDGPGFAEGVLDSDDFMAVKDRIRKTIPRSSVVGMVLQTQENHEVVKCRYFGLLQHDPFNWIVDGTEFAKAENIHRYTYVKDASVNRWIGNMDYERRQEFVELLFDVINKSGASDTRDFVSAPIKISMKMLKALETMDSEDRQIIRELMKDMSEAINKTVKEYISDQIK